MQAILAGLVWIGNGAIASADQFYVLQGIDKSHSDSVVTSPGLDGFTIRVSWRKLHEEGFAWLDEQIARGEELDINIQLRVMAGVHAPVDLPGVSYFDFLEDSDGIVTVRRAPVPWDTALHTHWQSLASQLGARYGGNSHIQIAHVPSFANSSEMHMPAEVTQLSGYSSRLLAESWAAMAEPLATAFSDAVISLNYVTPTQSKIDGLDSEWLLEELVAIAGDRAGYQANDFAADVSLERNKYETLLAQEELGQPIGFQMVSSSDSPRFGGDFLDAVSTAFEAGAQWLEIYANDIDNLPPSGDYNFNGVVDAADYTRWRDTLGQVGPALAADGNGNDRIDVGDYNVWKANFGQTPGGAAQFAVPEPTTCGLLGVADSLLMLLAARRRSSVL